MKIKIGIGIGIFLILVIIVVIITKYYKLPNSKATLEVVIVEVNENYLLAMGTDNQKGLYSIGISNFKDIKFEKGQEILVYFNGAILTSYPAQIGNVGKIKIIKDKSDIQIPDNIIRFCYNTKDKVNVIISELTNSGIALTITDTNELTYNYSHSYTINKKVKNENYTGVGQKIGEDTENSTSGFTRYRSSIYLERNK